MLTGSGRQAVANGYQKQIDHLKSERDRDLAKHSGCARPDVLAQPTNRRIETLTRIRDKATE